MRIEYLREFTDLADTLSFAITSKRHYLSPSTLSRHIAGLEQELGVALFERDGHSVRLTQIGLEFSKDARSIVEMHDKAIERVQMLRSSDRMLVRVGYLPDLVVSFPGMLHRKFSKAAPNVHLKFQSMEYDKLYSALFNREVDMAIMVDLDNELKERCEIVHLVESRYVLVSSRDHRLAGDGPCSVKELDGARIILPDPLNMPVLHRCAVEALGSIGVGHKVVSYYSDIPTLFFELDITGACSLILSHHQAQYSQGYSFREVKGLDRSTHVSAIWMRGIQKRIVETFECVFDTV